jgi:hypothetical protein
MLELIQNLDIEQVLFIFILSIISFPVSSVILISSTVIYMCNNLIKYFYISP